MEIARAFNNLTLEFGLCDGSSDRFTGLDKECGERTSVTHDDAVGNNVPTRRVHIVLDRPKYIYY